MDTRAEIGMIGIGDRLLVVFLKDILASVRMRSSWFMISSHSTGELFFHLLFYSRLYAHVQMESRIENRRRIG